MYRPLPPASSVLFTVDGSLPRPGSKGTMQAPQAQAASSICRGYTGIMWEQPGHIGIMEMKIETTVLLYYSGISSWHEIAGFGGQARRMRRFS